MQKLLLVTVSLFLTGGLWAFFRPLDWQTHEPIWTFYDRHGEVLYSEERFFADEDWSNDFLLTAVVALEDQDFYAHHGVNFLSLGRALHQNWQAGYTVSGASTITMQLARLLFLADQPRDTWYKVRQIWYALKLEQQLDKDEILALYLDQIQFGNGAVGISAASQAYFSKNPSQLSVGETVVLLAMVQNPSAFNPMTQPVQAQARQRFLLDRLARAGVLTPDEQIFWNTQSVALKPAITGEIIAPHFVLWAKEALRGQMVNQNPSSVLPLEKGVVSCGWGFLNFWLCPPAFVKGGNEGGLFSDEIHVYTTLDKSLYQASLKILRENLAHNRDKNITAGAVVVLDDQNKVRVLVGGPDFFAPGAGAVNLAMADRQTGSVLKPWLYAFAIEKGWSPLTALLDEKTIFGDGYLPRNFDITQENGRVRFREALANSYNIAAVDLLQRIGVSVFYNFCQNELGLDLPGTKSDLGLSLILGSAETSLWRLTQAYSIFSHQGKKLPVQWVERVIIREQVTENREQRIELRGESLEVRDQIVDSREQRVISLDTAEWVTHVLSDDQARWPNFSRGNSLELPFASAAKTGTSQGFKDNWVLGFSPQYTVGVWVGNPDGSAMYAVSGMQGAGVIWQRIMQLLHDDTATKNFSYQGNRQEVSVCRRPGETECSERVRGFALGLDLNRDQLAINNYQLTDSLDVRVGERLEMRDEITENREQRGELRGESEVIETEYFSSCPGEVGANRRGCPDSDFRLVYPVEGSVFRSGSDLLIQVRGADAEEVQYFFDGELLASPVVEDLVIGSYLVETVE